MGLVIGIKAGACSPSWLANPSLSVPMPTFYARPWQDVVDGQTLECNQFTMPPSWDSTFGTQYISAVGSLVTALKNTMLANGSGSLLDHVVAIADGGVLQTGSDEMGVFTNGCSIAGSVTMMTRYQVAQTWASLPWPDNYTPTKAQKAYRTIFDGMLDLVAQHRNKWGKQIAITQTMDGSEGYDWPRVDANGMPLPPQSPSIPAVAMYAPILQTAATDAMQCFSNNGTLISGGTTLRKV